MNKEWIPNSITMSNGIFGFLSIVSTARENFTLASLFIILSVIADRYDGIVARKLKVSSEIGKQLDSLSDVMSFGLAPGFLVFSKVAATNTLLLSIIAGIIAVIYVSCGAYRLARFNITVMKDGNFQGVPITAAGLSLAILSFSFLHLPHILLLLLTLLFAYLMVSKVKIKKF